MTLEDLTEPTPKSIVVTVKPWYQSKTVWLAVLVGILGATDALTSGSLLGAKAAAWVLVAKSVIDLIVRRLTTQPIGRAS